MPPPSRAGPAVACLSAALDAADAADLLGLDSGALRAAHASGARRVGFPGDAYVLALVGGTGVGKSSLLNALAGGVVSPASARRPTTSEPVAWVPATEREHLTPLLEWLGVDEIARARTDGPRSRRDPGPARHGLGRDRASGPRGGPASPRRCRRVGDRCREVRRRGPARRVPAPFLSASRSPGGHREQVRPPVAGRGPAHPARPRSRSGVRSDPRVRGPRPRVQHDVAGRHQGRAGMDRRRRRGEDHHPGADRGDSRGRRAGPCLAGRRRPGVGRNAVPGRGIANRGDRSSDRGGAARPRPAGRSTPGRRGYAGRGKVPRHWAGGPSDGLHLPHLGP